MTKLDGVPEPLSQGMTSGLTALDRARRGNAGSVRVMVVTMGDGGHIVRTAKVVGYSVTVAAPQDAARELAQHHHHVAFVDLPNLGAHGRETLALLLSTTPPIPALVVDTVDDLAAADQWIELGADDYLCTHQLGPSLLRGAVESAVSRNRAHELRRRLAHADRLAAIGTLAAGVAHEVNNPASYVLMNLKTCREHLATVREREPQLTTASQDLIDEMNEMLFDNLRGVERIVSIVHSLRSYARTDPDEIEPVDLAAVCREACDLIGNQLRQRARLRVELDAVAPIAADARKLGQVIVNLLLNAYDALPPITSGPLSPEVRVRLSARAGRIELAVSDTGVGIAANLHARIFEPFYTTKPRGEGVGLGLVVVRDIVERFGGKITVDSRPGAGSTFTAVFPSEEPAVEPAQVAVEAPASPRARVLIVDDEVALTSAMRRQLRATHDVTVLNDGAAAVAAVVKFDFDVVLCDLMMPGLDGIAVLEAVSQRRPEMTWRMVLMTAGMLQDAVRDRVTAVGGQVLDKPVPLDTLLAVIESIRGRSHAVPVPIE